MEGTPRLLPGAKSLQGTTHEDTTNWLLIVIVLLVALILFLVVGYSLGWMTWNGFSLPPSLGGSGTA